MTFAYVNRKGRSYYFRPVLRFILDDERTRTFYVERMTYRGERERVPT